MEQEEQTSLDIKKLFGADSSEIGKSRGCLVFFDTFPTNFTLDFDVMTPHNTEYYTSGGESPPSDMEKKIPLSFPCLTEKTSFNIHIACTDSKEWEEHSSYIEENLKYALLDYGLGAKTAYGYGLASNSIL